MSTKAFTHWRLLGHKLECITGEYDPVGLGGGSCRLFHRLVRPIRIAGGRLGPDNGRARLEQPVHEPLLVVQVGGGYLGAATMIALFVTMAPLARNATEAATHSISRLVIRGLLLDQDSRLG